MHDNVRNPYTQYVADNIAIEYVLKQYSAMICQDTKENTSHCNSDSW